VARDRQRAKQRKARRAQHSGPAPSQPRRDDVPGELQHASGEVDEFEAALVSGAEGQTVDDDQTVDDEPETRAEVDAADDEPETRAEVDAADDEPETRAEVDAADDEPETRAEVDAADDEVDVAADDRSAPDDEPLDDLSDDDLEQDDVDEATLEREAAAAAPRHEAADAGPASPPTRKGAGRFIAFLRASWAELQRVQWPDRRQVGQATGVVIGFVIVAGLYLGLADWVAKQVVNVII
jgi:preprotein translocase subunit SecE